MRWLPLSLGFLAAGLPAWAETALNVTYLRLETPPVPVLSNLDPIPWDDGIAGAKLGQSDNATTGKFLGQTYNLTVESVPPDGDIAAAAKTALAASPFLILDAEASAVLTVADLPEAKAAIILSVAAPDTRLRDADCRANVLHTGASFDMRADALMQVLLGKRWTRLALITGTHPVDKDWSAALSAAITKFGLELVGEKNWSERADLRRSASSEVSLFTQDLPDHDVLLIADESDDFARYVAYNTWLPRPVAGSEGMVPAGWSPTLEQWGAVQLQDRFEEAAQRPMRPRDYAAWVAMRTLGEALTRTGSTDPATLRRYILSDEFELDGFKGRPLSYRNWNGELRQPIPVAHARALVTLAPIEGFLHEYNELDTLGRDRRESACKAFGEQQ
ncbi:MAG TPA: ABC transporter substrate-binding protein [Albidovulum sp.]|uniref:ABC transporter substrate-binding protein n=1 Tax=Albidovulum sp. TaxID=1872424 RepID=UPI002CAB7FE4|nr:ABC transporter substrate-binding protein [Albidovulum sp.]